MQAQMGHILPIASLHDFEKTPVGLRHKPTKSTPEQITMVIAAKDQPKPEIFDGAVLVRHSEVISFRSATPTSKSSRRICFSTTWGMASPGSVRAVSEKTLALVASRTFALEMDAEQAAKLHAEEIQHAGAVPRHP